MPVGMSAHEQTDTLVMSHRDSVLINFRQSKWNLDLNFGTNAAALDSIGHTLTTLLDDSVFCLRHVSVYGGASPEGSVDFNRFLSQQRAETLFGWLDKYGRLSDSDKTFTFLGRDWEGVLRLAEKDPSLPYGDETLALLRAIVSEKRASGGQEPMSSLRRMKQLRGGVPYRYLYSNIFPAVRSSKLVIDYDRILIRKKSGIVTDETAMVPLLPLDLTVPVTPPVVNTRHKDPFYMAIYTNMLYDAVAVPNLGMEFYLGKNWSLGANYFHAWWSDDSRHRYWRIYGGELNLRRWFGKAAIGKPLTGHHLGVYIQALTYDFEWGGKAHMGGQPGGTIFDLAHFGGGVEYGYSLPVARRLNIDFSLAAGYIGGRDYEFVPDGDRYLWTDTKHRHWIGPTKLEVSLVWLIGRGNFNLGKGGKQ